jgi:hypothetical protein
MVTCLITLLFGLLGEKGVTVPGLGLAGEGGQDIFFGSGSWQ